MQQKSELPEGWKLVTFKDILDINPSKPSKDIVSPDAPITFVPMPAVDAISGKIIEPEIRCFSEVRKGYTVFRNDDVIFAKITPCMENGKAAIARNLLNNLGFGSTEFIVLRSKNAIIPDYLFHYIRQKSYLKLAESNMTGSVGQKRVPKDFVQNSSIPLPPLPEQYRIVSAIESLFARLDATNEKLDRVLEILKTFKESVLISACDGKLTDEWRIKLDTSKETYQNVQVIPEGWKSYKIGDIFEYWGGATPSTSDPSYWGGEIPWISSKDMKTWKILNGQKYITQKALEKTNLRKCPINSVLVVVRSGILAHTLTVAITESEVVINQDLKAFYNPDNNLNNWLALYLKGKAPEILSQNRKDGTTVQSIKFDELKNLKLLIPSKEEQQEIVKRVDTLLAFADSIETKVLAAREKTEKLRQSILAKAFSGKLVETEAEIARREGRDYEPAEVLLERIKREKVETSGRTTLSTFLD